MRYITVMLAGILIAATLTGCMSRDDGPDPRSGEQPIENTEDENKTKPVKIPDPTVEDIVRFNSTAGAEGNLTGFVWKVPQGAIVQNNENSSFEYLHLEILPEQTGEPEHNITDWALLVYILEEEGARLIYDYVAPTYHYDSQLAVVANSGTSQPSMGALWPTFSISDEWLKEGDRLAFVVAARAEETQPFNLYMRAHQDSADRGAQTVDELIDGAPVVNATAKGSGHAFQIARYAESTLGGVIKSVYWTDAVQVERGLPVDTGSAVQVRDISIRSSWDQTGWSYGYASYMGTAGHGTWSVDAQIHGTEFEKEGIMMAVSPFTLFGFVAAYLLFGSPSYAVIAEGDKEAAVQYNLLYADVGGLTSLTFSQIDLGATLQQLVGETAAPEAHAFLGVAGGDAPGTALVESQGHLGHLYEDGRRQSWIAGAAGLHPR